MAGITTWTVPVSTAIFQLNCNGAAEQPPGIRSSPRTVPDPPSTATVTASQKGITWARAAAMQTSDIPIHITPWAMPRTNVSGSGLAERERADQQRQIDASSV